MNDAISVVHLICVRNYNHCRSITKKGSHSFTFSQQKKQTFFVFFA
ncbi:hypothetical protein RV16_GL000141 [Enterococcus saccharolyticus]|nr:hypothetical protein RV16_GL000141 [Enterococcus saccharolyticus]